LHWYAIVSERIARTPENIKIVEIITVVLIAAPYASGVNVIEEQIPIKMAHSNTAQRQLTPKVLIEEYSDRSRIFIYYRTSKSTNP